VCVCARARQRARVSNCLDPVGPWHYRGKSLFFVVSSFKSFLCDERPTTEKYMPMSSLYQINGNHNVFVCVFVCMCALMSLQCVRNVM